jgi:hypothetical protein
MKPFTVHSGAYPRLQRDDAYEQQQYSLSLAAASVAPGSVNLIECDDDLERDQYDDNEF